MQAQMTFNGFDGLDHHHKFIVDEANKTVARFERGKEFLLQVLCRRGHRKASTKNSYYTCEILLYADPMRGDLFATKEADNFYSAIRSAFHAIEKGLRRESKTRISRRRRLAAQIQPVNEIA